MSRGRRGRKGGTGLRHTPTPPQPPDSVLRHPAGTPPHTTKMRISDFPRIAKTAARKRLTRVINATHGASRLSRAWKVPAAPPAALAAPREPDPRPVPI